MFCPGGGRDRPSVSIYSPHICPGWEVVVHFGTPLPGCRPGEWREEVGEEGERRA